MTTIPVKISNCVSNQLVELGIPFSLDAEFRLEQHKLVVKGSEEPVLVIPNAFWPSGSVKWATCYFVCPKQISEDLELCIVDLDKNDKRNENQNELMDADQVFRQAGLKGSELNVVDSEGSQQKFEFGLESLKTVSESGLEIFVAKLTANISQHIQCDWEITGFISHRQFKHRFRIRNTNCATHPAGQWDLGDPNSFLFKEICLNSQIESAEITLKNVFTDAPDSFECNGPFELTQFTSGGDNDFSKVHVDSNMQVPFEKSGFELQTPEEQYKGKRFEPILSVNNGSLALYVPKFWQNFPYGLASKEKELSLQIFPSQSYSHELQPGEQKTHEFWTWTNLESESTSNLVNGVQSNATVDPTYIQNCAVIPFFSAKPDIEFKAIIELGLDAANGFVAKKEFIDEFGWRNFGDLYADHENAEQTSDSFIVSHYNNQYDPVYGFLRQYFKSGDNRWLQLSSDLCQHVKDIDIYHTQLDKPEYNNGLFWHTDHYVDAATSTHRTYSKNQPSDVYMDHAGGGGPGGQHCYTTGLAFQYLMTGDETSKQAVIELCEWISNVYEGSGGFLEYLLAIKNSDTRIDLKNVKTNKYPLDRGTGNYITALLDSFEVSGKQSYLDRASKVIKQTVCLNEDLSNRNLDNVEETWFYTVFLQSVCRYIWAKSSNKQFDESFQYAKQLVIKFADWMAVNEQPYLLNPDILEFPNNTWTAQDLRKVNILLFANLLEQKASYLQKANSIYEFIVKALNQDANNHYCRILCILMQNEGMYSYSSEVELDIGSSLSVAFDNTSNPHSFKREAIERMFNTGIKSELEWLGGRIPKLNALMRVISND